MTKVKNAAALCCALSCAAGASAFVPGTFAPPFGGGGGGRTSSSSSLCGATTANVVVGATVCPPPSSGVVGVGVGVGVAGARRRRSLLGMTSSSSSSSSKGDGNGNGSDSSAADDSSGDSASSSSPSADEDASSSAAKKHPLRAEKDAEEEEEAKKGAKYERTYRIAQKRAEIESLLSGPDPPFDAEAELAKIPGGVQPPVGMEDDSSEAELEAKSGRLEAEIYEAAEGGEWDVAQAKRDELSREYLDDCGAVLQANLRFYRAFSAKDYGEMSKLWLHDASVLCVHPSHAPLVGASAVLGSWRRMFDTGEGAPAFRRNVVEPSRVRLSMRGSTAILTCDEEVYTRRFVRGERRKTELVNRLTATNVFRKVGGRWRMVHHHAAWHAESEAAKRALGGAGGGRKSSSSSKSARGEGEHQGPGSVESSRGIPDNEGITGKGYGEKSDNKKSGGGDDDPFSALEGLGGLGGGGGGNLNPDGSNGPIRRVFMGSLSDLLNGGGGLGDLLGSGSSDGKIIDASGKGSSGGGKGFGDDNDEGPSIIRFLSEDEEDDDEDFEDDDDDDLDVDVVDEDADVSIQFVSKSEDGKSGGATIIRSIKKGDKDDDSDKDGVATSKDSGAADATEVGLSIGGVPKDALRQNCISALRRLTAQGAISAKQKRVLLTDIILCSARGEFSMVEVAYELLCGECADGDTAENGCVAEERAMAEEEFADQCRAFAASLPESPPYSPAR
uniref:SnoaL-like domain-containing protein n=1 Tax=Odontella aurita TaxID=265563 RepID=A0A7S4MBM1_9STRA|mmetsp:Transcript_17252/g.50097  ORF Transcript_17252/g.50097 Transcript_17252/m.50097 type:complete len:729 (+) Transcript_17252:59-2245(+)